MDSKGLIRLQKVRELNADPTWVNQDLYRMMFMEDLYISAYERIKSSPGNMTKGSDGSTLDGFSLEEIQKIIVAMRNETFRFTRARRKYIPKSNGKLRPLGIPSPKDKVVQEVIRMILECIYDGDNPTFLDTSHGFRNGRSPHSCLRQIRSWDSVNWIVEGDIKGCFDNINHQRLIEILKKRIADQRFIDLIWKALTAGYLEGKTHRNSIVGTPQGSVVSPILANIYLHEFDVWVEGFRKKHESIGERKRINPAWTKVSKELNRIKAGKKRVHPEQYRELVKTKIRTPSLMHNDPNYIRIKYVRYADDWIIAFDGPRSLAEKFKEEATQFFASHLGLELSDEKTAIRNARKEHAHFLGTDITVGNGENTVVRTRPPKGTTLIKRSNNNASLIYMTMPREKVLNRIREAGFIDGDSNPIARLGWIEKEEWEIVERYSSILRGYRNYYSFVDNIYTVRYLQYLLQYSCAKTLCRKRQTSMKKLFSSIGPSCRVIKKRNDDGKGVSYAQLDLKQSWTKKRLGFSFGMGATDLISIGMHLYSRSKLGEKCVVCDSDDRIQMHHVRHIRKGKAEGFTRVLQQINRKQIPVCHKCHLDIHKGKYDGASLSDLANPVVASR
jgi:group II intron reverse transcriptase/maturase